MIRATELMVGDWVMDTRSNTPLRVNPFLAQLEVPEWEPIPLTTKILEKNGFNYLKETGYMCYEQLGDRQYNLIAVKGNILQMQFTSGNLEWTECRYAHELQHALRLCGINLEIKV